jgi:DNA-binding NtrC family response regulator
MNILIVDDDPNARKTLGKILRAKGFEVEEAGTGAEAVAACRDKFFNLVLIDVRLPDTSGLEVLKAVCGLNEDTIAIMMTGYASLDSSIEAMNKGAFSYFTKPVNMDQALIIIEKALEKQRLSLENKRLLKELAKQITELQAALAQIKTLQGILPICMYCKKIRDDKQYWQQVESYVTTHTEAQFSHGICPDCYKKYIQPEMDKLDNHGAQP